MKSCSSNLLLNSFSCSIWFLILSRCCFASSLVKYVGIIDSKSIIPIVENIYFFRRLINFDSGFGGRAELANQTFELLAFYDLPSILFGKGIGSTAIIHNISIHSGSLRQILELGIPFMILNLFIGLYIVLYARITNSRKYKNELRLGSTLMFALIIGDLMITSLWGVSLMSLFYCFALCILIVVLREKKSGTV